jgi:hypothetical protein
MRKTTTLTKLKLQQMRTLFGAAPVLASERHLHYLRLFDHYAKYVKPKNILELTLVMHLVDAVWLIIRYTRHHTLGIERWYQQSLAYQAERAKSQQQQKQGNADYLAGHQPADIAELARLEDADEEALAAVHEVKRRVAEIDHNRALEQGLAFQQALDALINSATARFTKALQLLEHSRAGLGQLLGQVTDQVFDAEFKEVAGDHGDQIAGPPLAVDQPAQSPAPDEHTAQSSSAE